MGYTTDFYGQFELDRPLTPEHARYLTTFAHTRRMQRDEAITAKRPDPIREAVGLPVGDEGGYFVGAGGSFGQEDGGAYDRETMTYSVNPTTGVIDHNGPPRGQPGLWCQWVPGTNEGNAFRYEPVTDELPDDDLRRFTGYDVIEWDGGEKFYEYVSWLEYLIEHFLKPWGYVLNGEVEWQGEDRGDAGKIVVTDNVVDTKLLVRQYE